MVGATNEVSVSGGSSVVVLLEVVVELVGIATELNI